MLMSCFLSFNRTEVEGLTGVIAETLRIEALLLHKQLALEQGVLKGLKGQSLPHDS